MPEVNELSLIKNILLNTLPNAEIWLFGSRTTGKAQKYSDVDILIKAEDKIPFVNTLASQRKVC